MAVPTVHRPISPLFSEHGPRRRPAISLPRGIQVVAHTPVPVEILAPASLSPCRLFQISELHCESNQTPSCFLLGGGYLNTISHFPPPPRGSIAVSFSPAPTVGWGPIDAEVKRTGSRGLHSLPTRKCLRWFPERFSHVPSAKNPSSPSTVRPNFVAWHHPTVNPTWWYPPPPPPEPGNHPPRGPAGTTPSPSALGRALLLACIAQAAPWPP